jgi:hypothetical protein
MRMPTHGLPIQKLRTNSAKSQPANADHPPMRLLHRIKRTSDMLSIYLFWNVDASAGLAGRASDGTA